jgi:hypothetical protein
MTGKKDGKGSIFVNSFDFIKKKIQNVINTRHYYLFIHLLLLVMDCQIKKSIQFACDLDMLMC